MSPCAEPQAGASWGAAAGPDTPFIAFRAFNDPELKPLVRLKARIDQRAYPHFPGNSLPARLVRELAARRALPIKEVFESFEVFERVRGGVRAPALADLCCGHGLTGILFAVFSRTIASVTLVDRRQPESYALVLEAAITVAPWVKGRVRFLEMPLSEVAPHLPVGSAVIAIHACGKRTDRCIELAQALGGPLAVMPCCYFDTAAAAPQSLVTALGPDLATDIHRSYLLEAAGYRVRWSAIPAAITPKRRILIATPTI